MAKASKPGYYAVKVGRKPGVYRTWDECRAQVDGFNGCKHKKFPTFAEADAFVKGGAPGPAAATTSTVSPHFAAKGKGRALEVEDRPAKRARPNEATTSVERRRQPDPVFGRGARSRDARRVYCDGSSRGNGKKGAVAGIGIFWSHAPGARNIAERLPGKLQTNNRAEMYAVARILETDPHPEKDLVICTDSAYTIGVFTGWIDNWKRRGWKTADGKPVSNKDLILFILSLLALRTVHRPAGHIATNMANVKFEKVKGHSGDEGNEMADQLANQGAMMSVAHERDFERLAEANQRKLRELQKTKGHKVGIEDVQWEYDLGDLEGALLSDDQLRDLERNQDF
ncbi:hypothetical protein JCM10212_003814 [Sporobolomyces blumeae]